MSVDHIPMVFVGLSEKLMNMERSELYSKTKGTVGLTLQCQDMDCDNAFIGFVVAEGESLSYSEFSTTEIKARINIFSSRFHSIFGIEPKVIIMDHISFEGKTHA